MPFRAAVFTLALSLTPSWNARGETSGPPPAADPPTVAAVQGDVDDAMNAANEFLTGCNSDRSSPGMAADPPCSRQFLHVPDGWPKTHLHLARDIFDYSAFYQHRSFIDKCGRPGLEASCQDGIEGHRILFYAGHGTPEGFTAISLLPIELRTFSVGDRGVRYLFTLSCNLFAHGRLISGSQSTDFTCPQCFDPQVFDVNKKSTEPGFVMANVFHSWGMNYEQQPKFRSPLNPHLRLACGASTIIGVANEAMHPFWHYFSNAHLTPADSFLVGLYDPTRAKGAIVPLCISRGDSYQGSGLVDSSFKDEPLAQDPESMGNSIFIAYPVKADPQPQFLAAFRAGSAKTDPGTRPATPADVQRLPVLSVDPAPTPSFLRGVSFGGQARGHGFQGDSAKELGLKLGLDLDKGGASFDRNDLCVVRQPKSGSMVFSWRPVAPGGGGQFAAAWKESVERAGTALAEVLLQNLSVKDDQKPGIGAGEPIVFRVQHDGAPKQQNLAANEFAAQKFDREHGFDRGQGCLYARLPLAYRQDRLEVEIAGEGAEKLVKVCPLSALSEDTFSPAADSPQDTCARSATPLVSVVYSGRAFHAGKADVHYTSFDTALQAARDRVKRDEPGGEYEDPDVRVVYRAAPAHCGQSEMYLMYRFDFQPKPASRLQGFPPLVIELPAQELRDKVGNNVKTVEETWDCEP